MQCHWRQGHCQCQLVLQQQQQQQSFFEICLPWVSSAADSPTLEQQPHTLLPVPNKANQQRMQSISQKVSQLVLYLGCSVWRVATHSLTHYTLSQSSTAELLCFCCCCISWVCFTSHFADMQKWPTDWLVNMGTLLSMSSVSQAKSTVISAVHRHCWPVLLLMLEEQKTIFSEGYWFKIATATTFPLR